MGEGGPLAEMPAEHRDAFLKQEFVVRAPLPWSEPDAQDIDLISTSGVGALADRLKLDAPAWRCRPMTPTSAIATLESAGRPTVVLW